MTEKQIKYLIIGVISLVLVVILNPIFIVSEGHRGLKFTLGKVSNTILKPGVGFKYPFFQSVEKLPITPLVYMKKIEVNENGAITKDNQTIGADIKVFYRYNEDKLVEMWSKYGVDRIEELGVASITESFKVVIGEYDIFNIAGSIDTLRERVLKNIILKMEKYPIEITDVNLLNFDWSDSFDAQIEQTMALAQQVKQKQQDLLITEQEAQKAVKKAQADKEATVLQAEGERDAAKLRAEAKALDGEGIAKYNKSILSTIEVELKLRQYEIEKIQAEKWNGQYVPNNMYGPIPVDTVGGVKGK